MSRTGTAFDDLLTAARACRLCITHPRGKPLPHEPRPVFQLSVSARILIAGQAPGVRVHATGRPFTDPSGDRLRRWLNLAPDVFYDEARIAILPMGFCFPGLSATGADLPPRRECAPAWRARLLAPLQDVRLIVALGAPAARWHLGLKSTHSLADLLAAWPQHAARTPPVFTLPHPSWRNNALLARNPWVEAEIVPALQKAVVRALA